MLIAWQFDSVTLWMEITREKIVKEILNDLNDALENINAEGIQNKNVYALNIKQRTITIKFNFHIVEKDNYIGLASY